MEPPQTYINVFDYAGGTVAIVVPNHYIQVIEDFRPREVDAHGWPTYVVDGAFTAINPAHVCSIAAKIDEQN